MNNLSNLVWTYVMNYWNSTMITIPLTSWNFVSLVEVNYGRSVGHCMDVVLTCIPLESLDTLTDWAVDKFKDVRNKNIPPPTFEGHPLTEKELKVRRSLARAMVWPFFLSETNLYQACQRRPLSRDDLPFPRSTPALWSSGKWMGECINDCHLIKDLSICPSKPGRYISHVIGHEGKGSILSLLKKNRWANYLQVGTIHGGIGFEFLRISVDLTEEGLGKDEWKA